MEPIQRDISNYFEQWEVEFLLDLGLLIQKRICALPPQGNKIRVTIDSGAHAGRRDKLGIEFSHQYL